MRINKSYRRPILPLNQLESMRSDTAPSGYFTIPRRSADCVGVQMPIVQPAQRRWRGDVTFASRLGTFCDYQVMIRLPRFLAPLLAGCVVTVLQVAMAVTLLAPE